MTVKRAIARQTNASPDHAGMKVFAGLIISISLLENAQRSRAFAAEENKALVDARELIANENSEETKR